MGIVLTTSELNAKIAEATAQERAALLAWLRSGKGIGGDDHVARTIADAIERGEHLPK
jgi:hypothetical protein